MDVSFEQVNFNDFPKIVELLEKGSNGLIFKNARLYVDAGAEYIAERKSIFLGKNLKDFEKENPDMKSKEVFDMFEQEYFINVESKNKKLNTLYFVKEFKVQITSLSLAKLNSIYLIEKLKKENKDINEYIYEVTKNLEENKFMKIEEDIAPKLLDFFSEAKKILEIENSDFDENFKDGSFVRQIINLEENKKN